MASWKKVIVSGSTANLAALQVDNLTSGSVVIGGGTNSNLTVRGINGTGNIVATTGATGLSASGSFSGSFLGNLTSTLANATKTNIVGYDTTTGIFTYQSTGSFTAASASFALTASYVPTAILTASANNSTITFTKFDGSTFNITVSQSGSVASASYAENANLLDGLNSTAFVLNSQTSSMSVLNAVSSSLAATASTVNILNAPGGVETYAIPFVGSAAYTGAQQLYTTSSGFTFDTGTGGVLNVKNLNGTASFALTASRVNVQVAPNVSDNYALTFVGPASYSGGQQLFATASGLSFDPGAQTLTVRNLAGTASFATRAVTASYVLNAVSASYALNSTSASFAISASEANFLDGYTATAFVLNSQTGSMSVATASYAISSSQATRVDSIANNVSNNVDNRVLTATGGGTINGEANLTFDGSTLTVTGDQIISGNLTVNGTTTSVNTDNLLVEDRFILLASGSNTPTDGGIIIQSGYTGNIARGLALMYDSNTARWGYTSSLDYNSTSAVPDAFASIVLDLDNGSSDVATYQKNGNIKVSSGDIFIYS